MQGDLHPPSDGKSRLIFKIFVVALSYGVAGKLSLFLAIPPGFATAIWPASGIAVAACLFWGWPAFIGTVIGSFCLNFKAINLDQIPTFSIPFLISFGAGVQAYLGAWLVRKWTGFPISIRSSGKIFSAILFAGPVACLLNGIWGPLVLQFHGLIKGYQTFENIWTWWMGDSLGVAISIPVIALCSEDFSHFSLKKKAQALSLLMASVTLTIIAYFFCRNWELEKERLAFVEIAEPAALQFQDILNEKIKELSLVERFIVSTKDMDRISFKTFVDNLTGRLGDQTIEWIPKVPLNLKDSFEKKLRAEGFTGFMIKEKNAKGAWIPAKEREHYFPVTYVEPFEVNKQAIGFDLASQVNRKEALEHCLSTGKATATDFIELVQDKRKAPALLLFYPVYQSSSALTDETSRRKSLKGFSLGLFRIGNLIEHVLASVLSRKDIAFQLYDASDGQKRLVYSSISSGKKIKESKFNYTKSLDYASRKWILDIRYTKLKSRFWITWAVMTLGSVLSCLLGIIQLIIIGRTSEIEREVNVKTKTLSEVNRRLGEEISMRKDKEADLIRSRQKAELAEQSKSEFLANMSHEIRTPMNGLSGSLDLLTSSKLDDEQQSLIGIMQQSLDSLKTIINDILDFSKISAGKMTIESIPVHVHQIVDNVISLMTIDAKEKSLEIKKTYSTENPIVLTDPTRLQQILLNLISNAIKFTREGEVKIDVHIDILDNREAHVIIKVIDTGIGMSKEFMNTIFERFTQADAGTARQFGGTGLGTTISKMLSQLLGGDLRVESEIDKGSTFTLDLMLKLAENQEEAKKEIDKLSRNRDYQTKVLLAEDNKINSVLAKKILKRIGVETTHVWNGQEALDIAQEQSHDLILMDVHMPTMDGITATKKLRESGYQKPIIAMTADVLEKNTDYYIENKFDDLIPKPFKTEDLVRVMDRFLKS